MPAPTPAGGPVQALAALRARPEPPAEDEDPDITELFEEPEPEPRRWDVRPHAGAWEQLAGGEEGVVLRRSDGTLWAARPLDVTEVLRVAFPTP